MDAANALARGSEVNGEAALRCRRDEPGRGIAEVAIRGAKHAEEAQVDELVGEQIGRRRRWWQLE